MVSFPDAPGESPAGLLLHLPEGAGQVEAFDALAEQPHADFVAQPLPMPRAVAERVGLLARAGERGHAA